MGNAHRRQKPSCLNSDVLFFRMRINSFEFPDCLFSVLFTWVSLSMNLYGQREREVMFPGTGGGGGVVLRGGRGNLC
jgi:hypothetical protein